MKKFFFSILPFAIAALIFRKNQLLQKKLKDLELSIPKTIAKAREDAVNTSRSVLKGKISEELVPFLPAFPFQPSDCKFMGAPVDYIVFEGMSENNVTQVSFLEMKTGNAKMNARQRQIKKCIQEGKVQFVEVPIKK